MINWLNIVLQSIIIIIINPLCACDVPIRSFSLSHARVSSRFRR